MKKVSLAFLCFSLLAVSGYAQNKTFGIGTSTPNVNAALHVESPTFNQGFLMPRLTTAQRTAMAGALSTADKGMLVYDITTNNIVVWNGTAWGISIVGTSADALPAVSGTATGIGPALVAARNGASGNHLAIFKNNTDTVVAIYNDGSTYTSTANSWTSFQSANKGDGFAGAFWIDKVTSDNSAIYAETHGTGVSIQGETKTGWTALKGTNYGTGNGGSFSIDNPASTSAALFSTTNGTGAAIQGQTDTGFAAIYGRREGATNGNAGKFEITDAGNTYPALQSNTDGSGSAGYFTINNASSGSPSVSASTIGTGAALFGSTSSGYAAVAGQHNGATNGFGGLFEVTNASNSYQALKVTTVGTSNAAYAEINNPSNNAPSFHAVTNGVGPAGNFQINNAASSATSLVVNTNGTGGAGYFNNSNTASSIPTLYSSSNGTGSAFQADANGSGNSFAGLFQTTSSSNTYPALQAVVAGNNSNGIYVNHKGTGGNLIVLTNNDVAAARIDKTGKGFFNNGTQNSGADVAELFDVEGNKQDYEPGDVLVISESTDRTVEKSSTPHSTKIIGVYATKPGVTLTEKGLEENLDALVPMGVIGVIPTKVCTENGPIKRGDLLVTSSIRGHAMKASMITINGISFYPSGIILGKALEDFSGAGTGKINVFVNVK